jgi:hypothetical protein
MERGADKSETPSLDDLALRMTAYRERATAVRRLADAIADKRATTELLANADEFEKKAEALAVRILLLAHTRSDGSDAGPSTKPINTTRQKRR